MAIATRSASQSAADSAHEFTRLHITPFNPTLLNVILPPSILPSAKNISYHSLQTFPEKSYGFVELPLMDAEKIKKKLNGSILKGSKVRIESARPSKERPVITMDIDEKPAKERKEKVEKGSRKRKRHDEVLPGVELRDRKVQRGWTTPSTESKKPTDKRHKDNKKDKKAKAVVKSKFTSQAECLFKTSLPPNVAAAAASLVKVVPVPEDHDVPLRRQTMSSKSRKEVVVHEFSKSTKHATFLRGSGVPAGSSAVADYVEGTGWVDKDGNVVEAEVPRSKAKGKDSALAVRNAVAKVEAESSSAVSDTSSEDGEEDSSEDEVEDSSMMKSHTPVVREASVTSSSGSSSEDEVEDSMMKTPTPVTREASVTSSSGSSSEEEVEAKEDDDDDSSSSESSASEDEQSRPTTSSNPPPNLSLHIPPISTTPLRIHPLEALYKKPPPGNSTTDTSTPSFSFFSKDSEEEDPQPNEANLTLAIPMTPFTRQDFEHRGMRSAAPTPDTAHPAGGKMWPGTFSNHSSNFSTHEQDDEDDEDDNEQDYAKSPIPSRSTKPSTSETKTGTEAPESDFQKWFYENRGDANRAWKKRRKVAGKEIRQRENKKRGGAV